MQVLKPGTSEKYAQHSLGQYIREKGYSRVFVTQYLLPMCAAVWSVPNAQVRALKGPPELTSITQSPPPSCQD